MIVEFLLSSSEGPPPHEATHLFARLPVVGDILR